MNPLESKNQIESIQLLRALAAIYVTSEHIPIKIFGDGFWGVDLFFIISGFIMCHATDKSQENFFLKRVLRVIPLYWIATLGIFLIAIFVPNLLKTSTADFSHFLKSLFFIPFKKGDLIVPLIFQGWTLNYEMFFYLIFAIAMKLNYNYRITISSVFILIFVISGKLFFLNSLIFQFFTNPIILEFILGMLAYILFNKFSECRKQRKSPISIPWVAFGILVIICLPFATNFFNFNERVIKWGIPSFICFFSIIHGMPDIKFSKKILLLGDASYSLYLFHPYVIQLFNKFFDLKSVNPNSFLAIPIVLGIIIFCCCFSILVFLYLEKPMTEFLRKRILFLKKG